MGTTTKYKPEMCAIVRQCGEQGMLVTMAAKELRIGTATFAGYEERFPEFREAAKLVRKNSADYARKRNERLLARTEDQLLKALEYVRRKRALERQRLNENVGIWRIQQLSRARSREAAWPIENPPE